MPLQKPMKKGKKPMKPYPASPPAKKKTGKKTAPPMRPGKDGY